MKIDEDKLESILKDFSDLENKLSDPNLIADIAKYQAAAKEHSALKDAAGKINELKKTRSDLENLDEILNSNEKELAHYAQAEKAGLLQKINNLEDEIALFLSPADINDSKNVIMEIRAGTGGEEAALFAGDLFRMYTRYAEHKSWRTEVLSANQTGLKGYKEVILSIEGANVYKHLKYESGVHRVQRVPLTEASGRVHTSAVTVAVLPEAEEIELEIKQDDLRIDTFCSSGKGGQSVNTTYSAIRITHNPSGIVVQCQDERSQQKNKLKAMKVLRTKLMDKALEEQRSSIDKSRKQHVGTGDRSEKIRTYNIPQDRITDHRINFTAHNLKALFDGELDELINTLAVKMTTDE